MIVRTAYSEERRGNQRGPPEGKTGRARHLTGAKASRAGKVRKRFWLDPALLREAQDSLGASTEREAVAMALDLVAFRKELSSGARKLRRLKLSRID